MDPVAYSIGKKALALAKDAIAKAEEALERPIQFVVVHDDTLISTTATTSTTLKTARFYKSGQATMILIITVWGDGTNRVVVEIRIDGSLVDTFSTTNNTETLFIREIDISGFGDGLHNIDINMFVDTGTGYTQFLEVRLQ